MCWSVYFRGIKLQKGLIKSLHSTVKPVLSGQSKIDKTKR